MRLKRVTFEESNCKTAQAALDTVTQAALERFEEVRLVDARIERSLSFPSSYEVEATFEVMW